jgi:hypothetical protein
MAIKIFVKNALYEISEYALRRMIERYISEDAIVEVLDTGELVEQPHGRDYYEKQIYYAETDEWVTIRVVVNETARMIVTVHTDEDEYDS